MKILKLINALPIVAIGVLAWHSLQPKTSRETLSVPQNQSATIQIPNGEPADADVAASLPEYEVVRESIHDGDTLRV
jgi:hypothetical protein